jgi:hypothetical protein
LDRVTQCVSNRLLSGPTAVAREWPLQGKLTMTDVSHGVLNASVLIRTRDARMVVDRFGGLGLEATKSWSELDAGRVTRWFRRAANT